MLRAPFFALSVLLLLSIESITGGADEPSYEVAQIVFISCNKHNGKQSYWDIIASTVEHKERMYLRDGSPDRALGGCAGIPSVDALVWLGDAVYADNFSFLGGSFPNTDMEIMREKFVRQRNAPEYTAFRHTCVRRRDPSQLKYPNGEEQYVLGVWDDHDMGKDDGGAEYKDKDKVQQLFLDFIGLADDDPRRKQEGVYSFEAIPFRSFEAQVSATDNSEVYDKNNNKGITTDENPSIANMALERLQRLYDAAVCIVLLDVRYFRDPANASRSGDMLGEPQWRWFEQRLRDDVAGRNPQTGRERCAVTVIGSGVQIFLDEKVTENWDAFPKSRDRLLMLLRKYRTERVLFISGDVHLGEIGIDTMNSSISTLGYPIIEATSSGLTHSSTKFLGLATFINWIFPTPRRVGIYVERNFGILQLTVNSDLGEVLSTATSEIERDRLEEYINISISIKSIPKHGESVLYLTLPLSALTHHSGWKFLNANVDAFGGLVKSEAGMSQNRDIMSEDSYDSETIQDRHYPSTSPTPPLTSIIKSVQRHVFPNFTLLEVALELVYIGLLVGIFVMISLILCFCYRGDLNKSKVA